MPVMENVQTRAYNEALQLISNLTNIEKDIEFKQNKINSCDAEVAVLTNKLNLIITAEEYHKKAIDLLYTSSLRDLEELINDVMNAVFYDQNIEIKMELSDSRSKSLIWYLIDHDKDITLPIKDSSGRGLRAVLSFIIQAYYVLSLGSKFLFIDEGYTFISESYVDKFFEFVDLLCKEKGLHLIMISHDGRFSGFADQRYGILQGKVYNQKDIDIKEFKAWSEAVDQEECNNDGMQQTINGSNESSG